MRLMKTFLLTLLMGGPMACLSQTTGSVGMGIALPPVALVDVEPPGNISMEFLAPVQAGLPITPPRANGSKWLNYTSAVSPAGNSRSISVSISQTLEGVELSLLTGTAAQGRGVLGLPSGQVVLGTTPVVILSGIRGASTGNGANSGHQLLFTISTSDYSVLRKLPATSIIINFTILE